MVPENTTEKKQKPLKQKETKKKKGNLHAKRNQKKKKKETSIFKIWRDTYTHMPKRAYHHKFTKLPYVHTNITKLKLNIRHYCVIKSNNFFCFSVFFFKHFFFHSVSQSMSQNGKFKNIKKNKTNKNKTMRTVNLCLFHSFNVSVFCQSCHSVQENWV